MTFIVTLILSVWLSIIVVVFEIAVSFKLIVSFPIVSFLGIYRGKTRSGKG
jgi:hypothetical protein